LARSVSIRALLSRADGSDSEIDLRDLGSGPVKRDELLWVDVAAATGDEVEAMRRALGLSEDAASAVESVPAKPNARVLDDTVEVVVLALGDGSPYSKSRTSFGSSSASWAPWRSPPSASHAGDAGSDSSAREIIHLP